jgi:type IV pilus assembly protein PilC
MALKREEKKEETKISEWAAVPPEEKSEKKVEEKAPTIRKASFLERSEKPFAVQKAEPQKKKWWQKDVSLGGAFLRVSLQEQILFARHLSLMSKAGMSLLDSIQLLKRQARSKSMAKILNEVANSVSNGQFLSVALEPYAHVFGELFINIIRIGETSGTLSENLTYLAEELDKKKQLQSKIRGAMVYPIIIVIGVISIVSFLVFFLFPKIIPVFKTLNVKLPLPTRILIAVANFAQNYTLWIVLGLVTFSVIFWLLLKIRKVKKFFQRALLLIPVTGALSKALNMASFCRTLAILLRSGSKIVESLGTAGNTLSNLVYRDQILKAAEVVRKGGQLSTHLATSPKIFPLMLSQMISVGEGTGNLSETLQYLAGFYEEEIDNTTKNLSTIIEPALLIILGGIVGFVAIAVITPIYGITQGVR